MLRELSCLQVGSWLGGSLRASSRSPGCACLCCPCCRYSASTISALEMMDDDKVDLDLIAALIRHIVLEEEVQWG